MKWLLNFYNVRYSPEYQKKRAKKSIKAKIISMFLEYYLLLLLTFIPIVANASIRQKECLSNYIQSYSNEITIKIQGTGLQNITSPIYNICPDHVYLDNVDLKGEDCHIVDIPSTGDETNSLRIVWNTDATFLANIFENLTNIVEVDLSKYDTSEVESMLQIFRNCSSLTSVNLTNINTSLAKSMRLMFGGCISLRELDVSKFDTSSVTDMHFMFSDCVLLTSLDVSHFDTSKVSHFEGMFAGMEKLESINVRSFDTSQAINMHGMFYRCNSFISLDVSSFDVTKVTDMSLMFYDNHNLKSLNLANFGTSEVTNINNMFAYCRTMESLDISNFKTPNLNSMVALFYECNRLKPIDVSSLDTSHVTSMEAVFFGCNDVTFLDLSTFETSNVRSMANMFAHTDHLASIELSNFDTSSVTDFNHMFKYALGLRSLDLSHFDTSSAIDMHCMFYSCWYLQSLDITKFDTHLVERMELMFYDCYFLASLDLSSFDTHLITNMEQIFHNCQSLKSLDLSSFDTHSVQTMREMFYGCQSLTFLNVSSFDTRLVENMESMFLDCISITSLDLSSFNTPKTNNMFTMFYNNEKLEEIHLTNIDTTSMFNMAGLFFLEKKLKYIDMKNYIEGENFFYIYQSLDYVPENIVVCIDPSNLNSIGRFNDELVKKRCHVIYCGEDWKSKQKKMVYGTDLICEEDCSNYKYEHEDWCYSYCPEGVDFCTPETPEEAKVETTAIATTDKYEPIISTSIKSTINNDRILSTNFYSTVQIVDNKESSYINMDSTNNNSYKQYISTNIENTSDNNSEGYSDNTNSINLAIQNKDNNSDYSSNNQLTMSSTNNINEQIISSSDNESNDSSNQISNNNSDDKKMSNNSENNSSEIISYDNSFQNNEEIYKEIIDNLVSKGEIIKGKEEFIQGFNNFVYHVTTTDKEKNYLNDKNNNSKQVSLIDLGFCENILKDHYHLSENDSLIIVKFEKIANISKERTLQYEVYEPYNKTKLDLSICDNTSITIYVPLVLSEELQNLYYQLKDNGYDLFDFNGQFYQGICTPFTTPNGTDILLSDRITYYYHNSETLCQSNCQFSDYSMESQYLTCSCDTSNSEINTKEINNFTPKTLYESFYDILKYSNYKVLWCYKLAFHINSVTINIGSIIAIIYFCIYFIFFINFCQTNIKQFKLDIANKLFKKKITKNENKDNNIDINEKPEENFETENTLKNDNADKYYKKSKSPRKSSKNLKSKSSKILHLYNFPPKKRSKSIALKPSINKNKPKNKERNSHFYIQSTQNVLKTNIDYTAKDTEQYKDNKNENKYSSNELIKYEQEKKLDDFELNDLDYEEAIKLDKRNFFQIYISSLKREHLIIFTFFMRNDHNLVYVKFSRFIFLVCTDMAMNVFFFSDETMHKMYLDYGKYNFVQQIAQILFSSIATQIIEVFICFLSLTDKHYYEIINIKYEERYKIFSILKCINRKITFYFIFTFLMFAFYWYSIACFCAVYPNTQKAFIIDSVTSFGVNLLYPFILYSIPSLLRLIALKAQKASCIYSVSDIIPFF